jgi:hypothetical protein
MKYTGNTVSKPVSGSEAKVLSEAIKTGKGVANELAWATIHRVADGIKRAKELNAR